MNGIVHFAGQRSVDPALTFNTVKARKNRRHDTHTKMRLAFGASAGMAGMPATFVFDFQKLWRKRDGELFADGFGNAHNHLSDAHAPKVKQFVFLFFRKAIP